MVYYKPSKIIINAPGLVKVIIDVIIIYHGLFNTIINNGNLELIAIFNRKRANTIMLVTP